MLVEEDFLDEANENVVVNKRKVKKSFSMIAIFFLCTFFFFVHCFEY